MALAYDLGPIDARSRKAQQRGQGAAKHKKNRVLQIHQNDTRRHDSCRECWRTLLICQYVAGIVGAAKELQIKSSPFLSLTAWVATPKN